MLHCISFSLVPCAANNLPSLCPHRWVLSSFNFHLWPSPALETNKHPYCTQSHVCIHWTDFSSSTHKNTEHTLTNQLEITNTYNCGRVHYGQVVAVLKSSSNGCRCNHQHQNQRTALLIQTHTHYHSFITIYAITSDKEKLVHLVWTLYYKGSACFFVLCISTMVSDDSVTPAL